MPLQGGGMEIIMPIKIPDQLPAVRTLRDENIFVITEGRAVTQDIRPLKIVIVNLMPTKIVTETQFARLLGNTPLQVETVLLKMRSHVSRNTSEEHMLAFYNTFDEIKDKRFDGMIITGAPVENLPFGEVGYWDELCCVMEWSKTHVTSTLHICWGAQAALWYHFGIPKYPLERKLFGIYRHRVEYKRSILFRGFDDEFWAPHSRHTQTLRRDIEAHPEIRILASSDEAGVYAASFDHGRQIFITGHAEYDRDTLKAEYLRDRERGLPISLPVNYFPDDDETRDPVVRWRSGANLLFSNWLNYFVYQATPYDIDTVGVERMPGED